MHPEMRRFSAITGIGLRGGCTGTPGSAMVILLIRGAFLVVCLLGLPRDALAGCRSAAGLLKPCPESRFGLRPGATGNPARGQK
jgi:hypothetical protein